MAKDLRTIASQLRDSSENCNRCLLARGRRRDLGSSVDGGDITFEEAREKYLSYLGECALDLAEYPADPSQSRYPCGNLNKGRREIDPHFMSVIITAAPEQGPSQQ